MHQSLPLPLDSIRPLLPYVLLLGVLSFAAGAALVFLTVGPPPGIFSTIAVPLCAAGLPY
jgi:hypothetical protein